MNINHRFTAAPSEDGMAWHCSCCDAVRSGPLAFCDSCEEVTESYQLSDDGSVSGSALSDLEARVLIDCDRLYELRRGDLGLAPTCQVGMRGVVA